MDSGTSNIILPQDVAEVRLFPCALSSMAILKFPLQAIYTVISPDIKPFTAEPGTYGIACSLIPSLTSEINITFLSVDNVPFNLTIPTSELSVGPFEEDPTVCQTLINTMEEAIIGGSLLKHYYSVWDGGNERMGFAPISN